MRTPELEARHRASVAISKMALVIAQAAVENFTEESITAAVPPLLVAMAVRMQEGEGKPHVSISEVARLTGVSRQTVRRLAEGLVAKGVLIRHFDGLISSDVFLQQIDPAYFRGVVTAIREAAKALEGYDE